MSDYDENYFLLRGYNHLCVLVYIMKDIETKEDIGVLVKTFYTKVMKDEVIAHFFTKVATFSWDEHIPIMIDFWENILLDGTAYKGNPMTKHFTLNKLSPMQAQHFERWLLLWQTTVHELFQGKVADAAIQRAKNIAALMLYKMNTHNVIPIKE